MINFDPTFGTLIAFYLSPAMLGIVVCIILFLLVAAGIAKYPQHKSMMVFDMLYEKVYNFYSDILGNEVGTNIKVYIATLFFVIFFANIS